MEKILMDQESLNRLDAEIAKINRELSAVYAEKAEELDQTRSEERAITIAHYRAKEMALLKQLRDLEAKRRYAELYVPTNTDEDVVDLGDYVKLNFDGTEETFRLLATSGSGVDGTISVEAPLGAAIYGARVGETVSYEAQGRQYSTTIIARSREPFEMAEIEELINRL